MISPTELIERYGNPILGRTHSGWCVPAPLWCQEHLDWGHIGGMSVLTHVELANRLDRLTARYPLDLSWVEEVYSWSPRCVHRDPSRPLSMHAWGLAIDINWTDNPYGQGNQTIPLEFVAAMEAMGFVWGGKWSDQDPHHFELGILA